jgi:hypothetical protein
LREHLLHSRCHPTAPPELRRCKPVRRRPADLLSGSHRFTLLLAMFSYLDYLQAVPSPRAVAFCNGLAPMHILQIQIRLPSRDICPTTTGKEEIRLDGLHGLSAPSTRAICHVQLLRLCKPPIPLTLTCLELEFTSLQLRAAGADRPWRPEIKA